MRSLVKVAISICIIAVIKNLHSAFQITGKFKHTPKSTTVFSSHITKEKPVFYMHIGPAKTGTSTIQAALTKYRVDLQHDNIVYVGRFNTDTTSKKIGGAYWLQPFENPAYCVHMVKEGSNCLKEMAKAFDKFHKDGKNVILSEEIVGIMFTEDADEDLKKWARVLRKFDVRILIGYRPLFEHVVSEHNQKWKRIIAQNRTRSNRWPNHGGKAVPPVRNKWNANGEIMDGGWPTTDRMAEKFGRYFSNITIFELHTDSDKDLVEYFLCDVMGSSSNTCSAQKAFVKSNSTEIRANPSIALDYDMLATAASEKRLFDVNLPSLTRHTVANQLKYKQESELGLTIRDFPLLCPSQDHVDALWESSLEMERKIFPTRGDTKLKKLFNETIRKKKLCNVDFETVLREKEWIKFFKALK